MTLILHAATTCFMTGLIWQIQCVQYPLFHKVTPDGFAVFHAEYVQRIGRVVFVAMPLEMFLAVYLFIASDFNHLRVWTGSGLVCLAFIWLSTALVQAPLHAKLRQKGYQPELVRALVQSNWMRTVFWSLRAIAALKILS